MNVMPTIHIGILDFTLFPEYPEFIECSLLHWAKLFKAQTWEDIHMLVSSYKDIENIVDVMMEAMADKEIRMQCEARRRYERDQRSLYNLAIREGHAKGRVQGITEGPSTGLSEGLEQGIFNSIRMLQDSGISKEKVILQLMNHFQLSTEEAVSKVDSY